MIMSTEKRVYRLEAHGPADTGMHEMECNPEDFASNLPTQTLHEYYEDEALGMSVGVWTTSPMQEAFGPYPGDEFVWLVEGGFKMVDGDDNVLDTYKQGECVYFRNAAPVSWVQEKHLRKFYITYLNPEREVPTGVPAEGAVKAVDPSITPEQMTALESTDPFIINGDKPVQRQYRYFTNDTGDMSVGLWDSTPLETRLAPFPYHEFARMLEGEIVITEEDGTVSMFQKDDVFFVPKGTVCSFETTEYTKLYYAVVSPPEE
jgi:hypothetical protein